MTDELNGKVLHEVVCLRSKLYSIDYIGGKKQSVKGVQKTVKKTLNHDLFKECLFVCDQNDDPVTFTLSSDSRQ